MWGMQTAAPQGGVGATIISYAENGGAPRSGLPFPNPPNTVAIKTRRHLLQALAQSPYADSVVQLLCQGSGDTSTIFTALNGSEPSQILAASGEWMQLLQHMLRVIPTLPAFLDKRQ